MRIEKWNSLPPRVGMTLLIAMRVRNAMETFHVKYLTDEQMAELNPLIRQAILDAILFLEESTENEDARLAVGYLVKMIPRYWEIPLERSSFDDMKIERDRDDRPVWPGMTPDDKAA